jgi:L-arabinose transport system substrate-binding protein
MMNRKLTHVFRGIAVALALASAPAFADDPIKIGFVVKQPEEPWFRDEWRFAEQAAKEKGFELVKIGAENGDKVLNAIDNLKVQHAQGFIICAPDVKLGPSIVAKARINHLKLITVDDRLVDGSGKPIEGVPYTGISAVNIGKQVGQAIAEQIKARGWNPAEVGALRVSFDQLPTARDRDDGAVEALLASGFPKANIFNAPQAKSDTENAFNASSIAITQHPQFKHWVAFGMNDEAVLGAVRAAEGRGVNAANMIGVGIGGSNSALNEFAKGQPTGFYGSILISPKRHGYDTSVQMYDWIKSDKAPPMITLTDGRLITRSNAADVRKAMGL